MGPGDGFALSWGGASAESLEMVADTPCMDTSQEIYLWSELLWANGLGLGQGPGGGWSGGWVGLSPGL